MLAVCALGPVEHARMELAAGRVAAGVAELSHENLRAGLGLAVDLVARRTGARASEIEALLPMAELTAILDRVARSQPAALREATGAIHPPKPGDSIAPVSLRLSDIASQAPGGGPSAALGALAAEVERWERVLATACAGLDRAPIIVAIDRRRRLRISIALVTVGVVSALVALFALAPAIERRAARERVAAALARPDPCAVGSLADADVDAAEPGDRDEVTARFQRCGAEALRVRKAEYLARRAEHDRQERERLAREREAACVALADHLEAGALAPADGPVAGEAAALLGRAASRALVAADFAEQGPALPCEGAAARPRIEVVVARAYAGASTIWAGLDDLPPRVVDLLAARASSIDERDRSALAWHAEQLAEKAARPEAARRVPGASRLCGLKAAIGHELGVACRALRRPAP